MREPSGGQNLVQFVQASVARWPQRPFIGTKSAPGEFRWITYQEFGARVDAVRGGLASLGVAPGGTVGVIANNRLEWALAHFAALGRNARWVPMYEAELVSTWEYILKDSGVEVLFVSRRDLLEKVQTFAANLPALRTIVLLEGEGEGTLAALEAVGRSAPVAVVQPSSDDIAALIYTSGTTGDAKGVLLSHGNLVSNHFGRRHKFPAFDEHSRTLSILPWAHVYGMGELHTWLELGGSIGIAAIDTLLADFALVKPTFVLAVPRVFNRIYSALWAKLRQDGGLRLRLFEAGVRAAARKRELQKTGQRSKRVDLQVALADRFIFSKVRERFGGRLTGAMTGSASMSEDLSHFFFDLGIPLYDAYGMTECSPGITLNSPTGYRSGSVGKPLEHVRVELDRSVVEPEATDGEIIVHGPNVMKGYHHQPAATAVVMTGDGGLRTGDRGRFDADGYLFITGRLKEQFKLENGKYVFPSALEELIELHPAVTTAFISGDGRPYCVGLLVIDEAAARKLAAEHGLAPDARPLPERTELNQLLTAQLTETLKGKFGSYEIPRKYALLAEPFTHENGLLTQTMKLKRRVIFSRFQPVIAALY